MLMRNIARTARGSLRSTRLPWPEPGSLIPIRCSLNMAVLDVPSVIDCTPTAAPLLELLYQGLVPATIGPVHSPSCRDRRH